MEKTLRLPRNHADGGSNNGKKILFANVPADGHFNPLTGLAVHLQSIGYDVRWYSSSIYEERIGKLNIPYYPFKKALEVTTDNLEQVFPERAKHKSQLGKLRFDMINFFILRSTEYYADIAEIHLSFPFDLLIADVAFSAIPFVKEILSIPVISIGVLPLGETSRDLGPAGLGMTPSNTWLGRLRQSILRFITDRILLGKPNKVMRNLLKEHGIETGTSNVFDILVHKSTLLLQSGTPSFEYTRSDLGENIRFIGALLPHSNQKKRATWFNEKLTKYNKVVLVTQGTLEKDPEKILVPTLEALKDSDCLVIATTGGSKTGELRRRFSNENIIVEDFIPFTDIMPYTDVYVTNGGYGGVMLAIENQVPLVVAGVHEGKNEINARVGYFNLGINLGTERPKPQEIKSSVERVLSNELYSSNVKQLSKEFRKYNPQKLCADYVANILGMKLDKDESSANYPERLSVY